MTSPALDLAYWRVRLEPQFDRTRKLCSEIASHVQDAERHVKRTEAVLWTLRAWHPARLGPSCANTIGSDS
jgi:hypothetical protein